MHHEKNKGEITCTALRNPVSFNGWGWELPSEFFHYKALSHVTNARRDSFQSRNCTIKIFEGGILWEVFWVALYNLI